MGPPKKEASRIYRCLNLARGRTSNWRALFYSNKRMRRALSTQNLLHLAQLLERLPRSRMRHFVERCFLNLTRTRYFFPIGNKRKRPKRACTKWFVKAKNSIKEESVCENRLSQKSTGTDSGFDVSSPSSSTSSEWANLSSSTLVTDEKTVDRSEQPIADSDSQQENVRKYAKGGSHETTDTGSTGTVEGNWDDCCVVFEKSPSIRAGTGTSEKFCLFNKSTGTEITNAGLSVCGDSLESTRECLILSFAEKCRTPLQKSLNRKHFPEIVNNAVLVPEYVDSHLPDNLKEEKQKASKYGDEKLQNSCEEENEGTKNAQQEQPEKGPASTSSPGFRIFRKRMGSFIDPTNTEPSEIKIDLHTCTAVAPVPVPVPDVNKTRPVMVDAETNTSTSTSTQTYKRKPNCRCLRSELKVRVLTQKVVGLKKLMWIRTRSRKNERQAFASLVKGHSKVIQSAVQVIRSQASFNEQLLNSWRELLAERRKSSVEEPSSEKPSIEEPFLMEPSSKEPSLKEPSSKELSSKEPSLKEQSLEEPSVKEPSSKEPQNHLTVSTSKDAISKEDKQPESASLSSEVRNRRTKEELKAKRKILSLNKSRINSNNGTGKQGREPREDAKKSEDASDSSILMLSPDGLSDNSSISSRYCSEVDVVDDSLTTNGKERKQDFTVHSPNHILSHFGNPDDEKTSVREKTVQELKKCLADLGEEDEKEEKRETEDFPKKRKHIRFLLDEGEEIEIGPSGGVTVNKQLQQSLANAPSSKNSQLKNQICGRNINLQGASTGGGVESKSGKSPPEVVGEDESWDQYIKELVGRLSQELSHPESMDHDPRNADEDSLQNSLKLQFSNEDVLSYLFLDEQVVFRTRKIDSNFEEFSYDESTVKKILMDLRRNGDVDAAQKAMVEFARRLGCLTDECFQKQMRQYLNAFSPCAPFYFHIHLDVQLGEEYLRVVVSEARCPGERINLLEAIKVTVEAPYRGNLLRFVDRNANTRNDQEATVLLGPASFVSHSCQPNTKVVSLDRWTVGIEAIRSILPGEELTISQGYDLCCSMKWYYSFCSFFCFSLGTSLEHN